MVYGSFRQDLDAVATTSSQSSLEARLAGSSLQNFRVKLGIAEFLLVCVAAYATSELYHRIVLHQSPNPEQYAAAALLLGATVSGVSLGFRGYNAIERRARHEFIWTGLSAVTVAFAWFIAAMFLFKIADSYSRGTLISQLVCIFAVVVTLRGVAYTRLQAAVSDGRIEARRVVLIGDREHCSKLSRRLNLVGIRTIRTFGFPGEHGMDLVRQAGAEAPYARRLIGECRIVNADVVILADETHRLATRSLALALSELPADIHVVPAEAVDMVEAARVVELGNMAAIQIARRPLSPMDRFIKRSFDLVLAASGLILLVPLLLLVAITIKLESRGPIIFRQTRHGFNNMPIRVLKFRSMSVMEDGGSFRQVVKGDGRITRVGRILRRTNIDELPQLINVLLGDMSIVGPRPHAIAHDEMFENLIWPFYRRHNVKPGITGWAQVNGFRGETDTLEKMQRRIECDLYYIDNWSFWLDIRIVIMTLFSAAAYSNAY
jgi:Undecaprenyl-phosphate glucose phosphotransferase